MKYKYAKVFSNGTEYEIFRENYCENKCKYHKERDDGFPALVNEGGCPIEDRMEYARFDTLMFPNVLFEMWENDKCINYHHCPFFEKEEKS